MCKNAEEVKKIEVKEAIHSKNLAIANQTKNLLTESKILGINVLGAPGAGKTSVITRISQGLENLKPYVLEGDIESDIDTKKLQSLGIDTFQVNTHGACHLDAPIVASALDAFDKQVPGVLFIENIGNLVCPAEFMIGEHVKLLVLNATDGGDKPYKYPVIFEKADLILLNKADLLSFVDFDMKFFMAGVRAVNPCAPVIQVSSAKNTGFKEVIEWITNQASTLCINQ